LNLFASHLLAREEVEVIGAAVIQIEKPEGAAPREEIPPLLEEPCPEEVPLERRTSFRVFPVHEHSEGDVPTRDGGAPAWG